MNLPSFDDFAAQARTQGFDEVLVREWPAGQEVDTHTHPFGVHALVVRGEFWLQCGDESRHLAAGQSFDLERDRPHAERYGAEGATVWVARRNAA